jgi:hypothetical protein
MYCSGRLHLEPHDRLEDDAGGARTRAASRNARDTSRLEGDLARPFSRVAAPVTVARNWTTGKPYPTPPWHEVRTPDFTFGTNCFGMAPGLDRSANSTFASDGTGSRRNLTRAKCPFYRR